jgi:citrate lyase synthetase
VAVIAIAISLGKSDFHTNAWRRVKMKRRRTMSDAMNDSSNANACVRDVVTSLEYWIAAIAATDMGKVYAHHRTENLQEKSPNNTYQHFSKTLAANPTKP